LQVIEEQQVDRVFLPFVALEQLAELVSTQNRHSGSLREVITAGEQLRITAAIIGMFASGRIRLINQYGPTESHVVSYYELAGPSKDWPLLPPIGRPIHNARLYILDPTGQPVPVGVSDELFIGGVTAAHGYLNHPELTAARFIPDPFQADPAARLYRTGDLCRWLPDGNLEFLGRLDQQVKIRGYRVEPGEVEAVVEKHPAVRECVVTVWEVAPGEQQLAGYVIPVEHETCSNRELRGYVRQYLPDYMVPACFELLSKFPLTPSGKVDRRALPAPGRSREVGGQPYAPPQSPMEEALAGIWAEVLNLPWIGRRDNFFELGGHSLQAMRVIARISHELKVKVTVRQLLEAQTIEALASQLGTGGMEFHAPIQPVSRESSPQLSFAQERLWFLAEYEPESTAYHLPQAYRLAGNLGVEVLERALAEIVQRHESLRTTFRMIDGQAVQIIAPFAGFRLPVADLTELPPPAREPAARRLIAEDVAVPFDLASGPLFKAKLFRLEATDHILLVNSHHIISDGWSLGVFCNELSGFHTAFQTGQPASMPPLAVQYADYAVWQRQWLRGEVLEEQVRYWLGHLADAPVLELPTDHPRPLRQTYAGATLPIIIPSELAARLNDFNRELLATPFMTLLAVFQVLLSRHSGQTDILVGTPIANRQRIEVEDLIGFFVNTLVMRGDLSGGPGFREVVERGRRVALDAYQHQGLPFEELVRRLNPARDLGRHPLFQVMFALQNAPEHALELAGLTTSVQPLPGSTTHFDLELHLWQRRDEWVGNFVYNTDLFDAATIERMAGHYLTLLEALLTEPERSVMEVPMLTAAERHQLLVEWNATTTDYPRDKCVHELFEQQVERTPDAVAVVLGEQSLTYRELDQQANRAACRLREIGVGVGDLVAVCIERSFAELAAVLGIMKTGAAYVPLDPDYPQQRQIQMLEDSGAGVLLAQGKFVSRFPADQPLMVWETMAQTCTRVSERLSGGADPNRNWAYVIYTSGSTGKPKGAYLPQAS
jgi:non-ribosomal peptide synthetase component F/acyl carrier protein